MKLRYLARRRPSSPSRRPPRPLAEKLDCSKTGADTTLCLKTGGWTEITGTDRADTITGTKGPDQILGDGGNDRIFAGSGGDEIDGGDGRDTIDAGRGNDMVYARDKNARHDRLRRRQDTTSPIVDRRRPREGHSREDGVIRGRARAGARPRPASASRRAGPASAVPARPRRRDPRSGGR